MLTPGYFIHNALMRKNSHSFKPDKATLYLTNVNCRVQALPNIHNNVHLPDLSNIKKNMMKPILGDSF